MSPGLRASLVTCLCATVTGCAQSGSLLSQRTSVGTLKTGLSHLEYENKELRGKVANLNAENREVGDRLVQEQAANGELTARLDDARSLLRDRGLAKNEEPGTDPPPQTLPAGRSNRKRRKPPFAQVPGRIDPLPPATEDRDSEDPRASPPGRSEEVPGLQGRLERFTPWLPVAGGSTEPTSPRR